MSLSDRPKQGWQEQLAQAEYPLVKKNRKLRYRNGQSMRNQKRLEEREEKTKQTLIKEVSGR